MKDLKKCLSPRLAVTDIGEYSVDCGECINCKRAMKVIRKQIRRLSKGDDETIKQLERLCLGKK